VGVEKDESRVIEHSYPTMACRGGDCTKGRFKRGRNRGRGARVPKSTHIKAKSKGDVRLTGGGSSKGAETRYR